MNFSDVIKSLNQASAFELYRMQAAIARVLGDPKWLQAIQARIQVGQEVSYFSVKTNTLKRARVMELRRKQVILRDLDDAESWNIDYAAINLNGADVQIREWCLNLSIGCNGLVATKSIAVGLPGTAVGGGHVAR